MDSIKVWVARDKCSNKEEGRPAILYGYEFEPIRKEYYWTYSDVETYGVFELPREWFPEVTWENSPKQIEIKLIEK